MMRFSSITVRRRVALLLGVSLALTSSFGAVPAPIALVNYTGGETLRYTVPLIRGTLADKSLTAVEVVNESSTRDTARMSCLAYDGRFKALAELVPGTNRLVIRAGTNSLALRLVYKPQTSPYVVRIIYATDKTGDTSYQTPIKDDPQDYAGKLGTMMLMMQSFSAERMNDMGMGRRTFNLELDEAGKVKVHVLKCDKTAAEIYNMGGGRGRLFSYLAAQVRSQLQQDKARNVVITAFSKFNPATKHNMAYAALGGGNTAWFGGSNLYSYPRRLADIQAAFMDATPIDTDNYSSDSVGRHAFWANASTSIGAALHELGHTFDLPHSRDGFDIMTRGMDFFSRFWVLREAPKRGQTQIQDFKEERGARWTLASAAFLRYTPWFAMDDREYGKENRIQARLGRDADEFIVTSPDGIGAVLLGSPGSISTAVPRDWSTPEPTSVVVNAKAFAKDLDGDRPWLRIIDSQGHVTNAFLKALRAPGGQAK